MSEPFKFIHAADLHLDQPFSGIAEVPPHVRATLVDAPYVAAERIFDAALSEQVDFLILSGDVADLDSCGPRVFAFLLEQFKRLAAKSIAVYWAGGKVDQPDRWPVDFDDIVGCNAILLAAGLDHSEHLRRPLCAATCGAAFMTRTSCKFCTDCSGRTLDSHRDDCRNASDSAVAFYGVTVEGVLIVQ